MADFDNDGDLDLVINNLDGEADLYENVANSKNNYLRFKLEGPTGNPDGIGTKISLYYNGKLQQFFQQKIVGDTFHVTNRSGILDWAKSS